MNHSGANALLRLGSVASVSAVVLALTAMPAMAADNFLIDLSAPEETLSADTADFFEEGLRVQIDGKTSVLPYARIRAVRSASDTTSVSMGPEPRSNVLVIDVFGLVSKYALLSYERRLHSRVGVSVNAGLGMSGSNTRREIAWNVGAQGRFYVFGHFAHGGFAGLDFTHMTGDPQGLVKSGDSATPFIGYRRISAVGLVLEGLVGPAFNLSTGTKSLLVRLNVGAAF